MRDQSNYKVSGLLSDLRSPEPKQICPNNKQSKLRPAKSRRMTGLTVGLPEDDAVDDVRARVAACVPCILVARKRAPIERRVRIRDVGHQRLGDGEIGLTPQSSIGTKMRTQPHVIRMSHRSVLKVDVVRLEVGVSEERLQRCACGACPDQGGVEGGRDEEHGGLGVVHACVDELVVPDVD